MGTLRVFLAASVLVTHLRYGRGIFGLSFLNGQLAVETFFIISGFYMALVLTEKYNYPGSYWTFVQQRFLRLYPLYIVVTILIVAVDGLMSYCTGQPFGIFQAVESAPVITLWQGCYYGLVNLTILGVDTLRFLHQDKITGVIYLTPYLSNSTNECIYFSPNAPVWTLGVEMTFYLLAPFLVRRSVLVQSAYLLTSLLFRSILYWTMLPSMSEPWTSYFSPLLLFFFMAGSIGYRFYKINRASFEKFSARYFWIFWVFGLLAIDERRMPFKDYFFFLFVPLAIVLIPLLFAYTRNNKWDSWIGELSYPFYLVHFTIVKVMEAFLHEKIDSLFGPICLVISFGVALFLYQVIETRTEHYREKLFQKVRPHLQPSAPS